MKAFGKALVGLLLAAGAAGSGWYWYAGGAQPERQARPERAPPAVVLAEARREAVTRTIEAVGNTVAAESVTVSPKSPGRIVEISFTDGQTVKAGDVLVRLDEDEARAELAAVEAEAAEIRQALGRSEELFNRGSGARAPVDDARRRLQAAQARVASARKRLDDTAVRAPFAGRVGLRDVSLGALVEPSTALATLDSVNPIAVRMSVPEQSLAEVTKGTRIEARSSAYPERVFQGEIRALASRVDPALRTISAEAVLPNPEGALLPGMLMNVTIAVETVREAVVVPPLAVMVRGDEHFVYRVADGKAERVRVETGQREPERLEIRKGLEPGDRVVVEGLAGVAEGKPVRVVEPKPDPAAPKPPEAGAQAAGPANPAGQEQPPNTQAAAPRAEPRAPVQASGAEAPKARKPARAAAERSEPDATGSTRPKPKG